MMGEYESDGPQRSVWGGWPQRDAGLAETAVSQDGTPAQANTDAPAPSAPAPAAVTGPEATSGGSPSEDVRDFIASIETTHTPTLTAPPLRTPSAGPRDERAYEERASDGQTYDSRTYDDPIHDRDELGGGYSLLGGLNRGALVTFLARPFARRVTIAVAVAPFVVMLLGFVLQALLAGGDWTQGAFAASIDAFLLALVVAIGGVARYMLGRRGTATVALGGALCVGLLASGGGGLLLAHSAHYFQGQALERAAKWSDAIQQYQVYGEKAPHAPDIARVEVAWGEQLLARMQYGDAGKQLSLGLAANPSDTALADRAAKDLYLTYSAWLAGGGEGMPYGNAAAGFAAYRASQTCDSACQTTVAGLEAQVRFLYGGQLTNVSDYADAIVQFELVQSQFPSSPYAAQAHAAAAKAYSSYGAQQLGNTDTCKGALPSASQDQANKYKQVLTTYQTLASKYADTPEGQQAVGVLAAPQPVSGVLTSIPTNPLPTAHLSKTANPSKFNFSNEYNTSIDGGSGAFTFANVAQGDYNLHTSRDLGNKIEYQVISSSSGNLYSVHVGPLCPIALGQIKY
jgi:hypothetical protein